MDSWGPSRPGQQGCHKVGCGTQGRARFIGTLRKARERHTGSSLRPPSDQIAWRGRVRSPEKRTEMAHPGTGHWLLMRVAT